MKNLSPRSDALSAAGRAAHDVGAAALLGGNLFARAAMHPALKDACTRQVERGRITNAAWRRYGVINSLSLLAVLVAAGSARAPTRRADRFLSDRERCLARARDIAVGAVAVTGVASAIAGIQFSRSAPGGAVPLEDGSHPAPETPPESRGSSAR